MNFKATPTTIERFYRLTETIFALFSNARSRSCASNRSRSLAAKNQRGQDLRRKILAGAIVLAKIESGEMDRGQFRHWLDQGLSRTDDRELFELPVRDAE